MREFALIAYCCFITLYVGLGWWIGLVYLIASALIGVLLHAFRA